MYRYGSFIVLGYVGWAGVAGTGVAETGFAGLSFAYDPVSIAASIIRFPLIIEVVQMTMFFRSATVSAFAV
jgi:hypothetical protein